MTSTMYAGIFCIAFTFFGIILFVLARWSRRQNTQLQASGKDDREGALKEAASSGQPPDMKILYCGSMSKPVAFVGKLLALIAIIMFAIFIVYAALLSKKLFF